MGTFYVTIYRQEAQQRLENDIDTFLSSKLDPKFVPGSNRLDNTRDLIQDFSSSDIPMNFFSFHEKTARFFFEKAGFEVEEVYYTTIDGVNFAKDGREYVAVVARKPMA